MYVSLNESSKDMKITSSLMFINLFLFFDGTDYESHFEFSEHEITRSCSNFKYCSTKVFFVLCMLQINAIDGCSFME